MSKVAQYLQEHLSGEVIDSSDARHYFSTDGSIFQISPSLIVYPRNENDIRKIARFSWQLAERGRTIPLTARGSGSDQSGAAIGRGMIIVFPAHMNNILELNSKSGEVIVEPGLILGKLQQTLLTHNKYIPALPESLEYESVGGVIANNSSGDQSFKFGDISNYIKSLRVVLANGEIIETKRLSKRELNKKLGLSTFEGEIYRYIDTLIEEQHEILKKLERGTTKNNSGYNLLDIKQKDGSFDLTPLIAGSQGTLGIITEAILSCEDYEPKTSFIVSSFDSIEKLQNAILDLRDLPEKPISIELIDQMALKLLSQQNPNHLKDVLPSPYPHFVLLIQNEVKAKKNIKKITKILDEFSHSSEYYTEIDDLPRYQKLREAINILNVHNDGLIHSIPLFDGAVPPNRLREYIEGIHKIITINNVRSGIWGHIGDANLFFQPRLNIGQVGDRQKAFRLIDEHSKLVISLGGTISAAKGDGRLKAPYLDKMYGNDVYGLLSKLKRIFDPYNILNPGVKFGTNLDDLKAIVRSEYTLNYLYTHLPKS